MGGSSCTLQRMISATNFPLPSCHMPLLPLWHWYEPFPTPHTVCVLYRRLLVQYEATEQEVASKGVPIELKSLDSPITFKQVRELAAKCSQKFFI